MLPPDFIQRLACPICKGGVIQQDNGATLRCSRCNREYTVIDGIPVLLPDNVDRREEL